MGNFLVVSKIEHLAEHQKIAEEYGVSLELNDFFLPSVLDDEEKRETWIQRYLASGIPKNSTIHGVFLDLALFSEDQKICDVTKFRMLQSMQIARQLGVKGVVFHTNYNPALRSPSYKEHFIDATAAYLSELLETFDDIEIYIENMFDATPEMLEKISKRLCHYQNYGVCLDWAHVHVYGRLNGDDRCMERNIEHYIKHLQEEWVRALYPYIKHIHINDNDLQDDLHLPVGDGKLDWQQFFAYYRQYFQNCSVLIETTDPAGQRKSLEYIKQHFRQQRADEQPIGKGMIE